MTSIRAACAEANKHVTIIRASRTSYLIYGPLRDNDLRGASTELTADSYQKAATKAKGWRVSIAISLLGLDSENAEHYWAIDDALHDPTTRGSSTREIVSSIMRRAKS